MKKILVILILSFVSAAFYAQNSTTQDYLLAYQYYRNNEYDKAAEIYKKLFDRTGTSTYFTFYINCLYQTGQYQQAIKEAKKAVRTHKNTPYYKIILGQAYKMSGDTAKAESIFEKVIKSVPPGKTSVISTANQFINIREYKYAEQLYLTAKKKFKKDYTFNMELGQLYFLQRKYDKMINAYLDMLATSPDYYETVKGRLQYMITSSANNEIVPILRKELIRRIQKKPSETQYTNLMIWLLLQQHRYGEALHYALALDRREKNPEQILSIGKTLMNNGQYELATKAFTHIMDKYDKNSLQYLFAKTYYLQTLFLKLTQNKKTPVRELYILKKDFEATFETYSYNNSTFPAVKNYALLLGKFLHKPDSAIHFLETVTEKYAPRFDPPKLWELKLILGDMYLINGDPWTATIIYSRIERQNTAPELRDKAKLKKAYMAFYQGDIKWAKALLDVLKGSTSKPVANDAFKLSEFIANNTSFDTNTTPLKMYGRAMLLDFAGYDSLAILSLDSIISRFPEHSIIDDVYLKKGELYENSGKYQQAIEAYKYIVDYYPFDILADNALYRLATLYDKILNQPEKALKYYKKIMIDYPESIFAEEARKRYDSISSHKN